MELTRRFVLMDVSGQAMNNSTKVSAISMRLHLVLSDDALAVVICWLHEATGGADIDAISEVKSASEAADLSKLAKRE